MTQDTPLAALPDYQEQRPHLFPSPSSLAWYVRQHRAELVKAGALVWHAGHWLVVTDHFDACVMDAGKRAAEARQATAAVQA
jgi:hypothetical protein